LEPSSSFSQLMTKRGSLVVVGQRVNSRWLPALRACTDVVALNTPSPAWTRPIASIGHALKGII
jgi:hypothetical protein